jgi:hypothetical protein
MIDRQLKENTSSEGAAAGAAIGFILAWLADAAFAMDVPLAVQGAIAVVTTYLLARLLPPRS